MAPLESMYRQNAPPPPPDQRALAAQAVKNCANIQLAIAALNLVSVVLLVPYFWFYKLPEQFQVGADIQHQVRNYAFGGAFAYVLIFAVWAAVNAWGLKKRSKVARISSLAFALAIIMTCCAAPFGGFLLYLLFRRDVKEHFDAPPASVPGGP